MFESKNKRHPIESYCRQQVKKLGIHSVIATISGGPDSVALLAALSSSGVTVTAAHCNFHLRGEESMRDERFVRDLCSRLDVSLKTIDFDVAAHMASNRGASVEMACRELRHKWFADIRSEMDADRIATGHNADDNIETLFLNLMRGSGTSGLRAMLPDTGSIWRPLLAFHRTEILRYLEERSLEYVTDSTNLTSDYRRNFLRNEVIPLLRTRWAGFDKALDRSLSFLREENKVVAFAVESALPGAGKPLHADTVMSFPDPELLVRRFIEPAGPFTTTASEVIAAIRADKPDIRKWKLAKGGLLLRNHRLFLLYEAHL